MKKINKKGFMLAELLAVTAVIMIAFVVVFSNFMPTQGEYEKRINYNDVTSQYAAFYMRKIYKDIKPSDFNLGDKGFSVLYSTNAPDTCYFLGDESKSKKCGALAKELGIQELIVTKYQLDENLLSRYNNYYKSNSKEGLLGKYIEYLPQYKADMWLEGEGWSFNDCTSNYVQKKTVYRKTENNKPVGEWLNERPTEGNYIQKDICRAEDLYRLILKTDYGYANTELYVKLFDDGKSPICKISSPKDKSGLEVSGEIQAELNDALVKYEISCTDTSEFDTSSIGQLNAESFYVVDSLSNDVTDKFKISVSSYTFNEEENKYTWNVELKPIDENSMDVVASLRLKENIIFDIFAHGNSIYDQDTFIQFVPIEHEGTN